MKYFKDFKPQLTCNFKTGSVQDWDALLKIPKDYLVSAKLDGVRAELFKTGSRDGGVLSRALKPFPSARINEMGLAVIKSMSQPGWIIECEIWGEGLTLPEIQHFTRTENVESEKTKLKYEKLFKKTGGLEDWVDVPGKGLVNKGWQFPGRGVEFLTTWPKQLKFYAFDIFGGTIAIDKNERISNLKGVYTDPMRDAGLELIDQHIFSTVEEIINFSESIIQGGGEGAMVVHKSSIYKYGRWSEKSGMAYKMKDNKREYRVKILDVYPQTAVKDGVAKTRNELGRSVTSKKKGDRDVSDIAGGFLVKMADGQHLKTGLLGFDHDARRKLLRTVKAYKGLFITIVGMPPVKEGGLPRHSHYIRKSHEANKD